MWLAGDYYYCSFSLNTLLTILNAVLKRGTSPPTSESCLSAEIIVPCLVYFRYYTMQYQQLDVRPGLYVSRFKRKPLSPI